MFSNHSRIKLANNDRKISEKNILTYLEINNTLLSNLWVQEKL